MSLLETTFQELSIHGVKSSAEVGSMEQGHIETEAADAIICDSCSAYPGKATPSAAHSLVPGEEDTLEDDSTRVRKKAYRILEQVDNLVEKLRFEALRIEDDKESILSSLDSLKNSSELQCLPEGEYREITSVLDTLVARLLTVDIRVHTHRNQIQEEALYRVNGCIDELVLQFQQDPINTRATCINCLEVCENAGIFPGSGELGFASALAECTRDDHKRIKRRLQGLLTYMDSCQRNLQLEILE